MMQERHAGLNPGERESSMMLSWRRRLYLRLEGLTGWEEVRRRSSRYKIAFGVAGEDEVEAGVAGKTVENRGAGVLSV